MTVNTLKIHFFASIEKVRKLTSEVFRVENEMEIAIHVGKIGRGGGGSKFNRTL